MTIEKIKHHILIDGIWETIILESNEPRVYIQKGVLYSKQMFYKDKESLGLVYFDYQINQIVAIFDKDWSTYF